MPRFIPKRPEVWEYVWMAGATALVTVLALPFPESAAYSIGLVYLLQLSLMSLKVGRWPMLFGGVLCAVIWEYIFVPPRWDFALHSTPDMLLVAIYVAVALVTGEMADRIRTQAKRERLREESERLHRTLLDSVSHELRTPLAVLTVAVENLEEGRDPSPPVLAEMRMAIRRLNRLVANLLDQTRLESGSLRPRVDWCDVSDIVQAALGGVREAFAGGTLTLAIPGDLEPVRADFALTEHALTNLILNAALHTPPGTPVTVSAGIEHQGARAFISVADRGPGLPAALRPKLFQKFSRAEGARAGGLGLGLSIARGFIAAQGGDLVGSDQPGGGTVFTIYLPHSPLHPEPPE